MVKVVSLRVDLGVRYFLKVFATPRDGLELRVYSISLDSNRPYIRKPGRICSSLRLTWYHRAVQPANKRREPMRWTRLVGVQSLELLVRPHSVPDLQKTLSNAQEADAVHQSLTCSRWNGERADVLLEERGKWALTMVTGAMDVDAPQRKDRRVQNDANPHRHCWSPGQPTLQGCRGGLWCHHEQSIKHRLELLGHHWTPGDET